MRFHLLVTLLLTVGSIILLSGFVIGLLAIPTNNLWQGSLGLLMMGIGWTFLDPDGAYDSIKKWNEKRKNSKLMSPIN